MGYFWFCKMREERERGRIMALGDIWKDLGIRKISRQRARGTKCICSIGLIGDIHLFCFSTCCLDPFPHNYAELVH